METSMVIPISPRNSSEHSRDSLIITSRLRPSRDDWQRWKPMIMQRYRTVSARMLVAEMHAEGLKVTEKMLRDRLSQWKCNDKNSSRADCRGRRARKVRDLRTFETSDESDYHHTIDGEILRSFQSADESLRNSIRTSPELLDLGTTLKSVLNWQLNITDSKADLGNVKSDANRFMRHVQRMVTAVSHLRNHSIPARLAIRELRETSARLATNFRTECTPLAIMISIWNLANLKQHSSSHQWHAQTCHFLLRIATEMLQPLDPALLLMRQMIVVEHTQEALAMIHEVGCQITKWDFGNSLLLRFRVKFFYAAMHFGLLDSSRSHFDTFIDALAETDAGAPRMLLHIGTLRYREGRLDESVQLAERCLDLLKTQGREILWVAHDAWALLADIKRKQSDLVSEEYFLRRALRVAELQDPDIAFKSGGDNLVVSETIWRLHQIYENQTKFDECEALYLRYPHIFTGNWAAEETSANTVACDHPVSFVESATQEG